jgi:AcrR family transcriptional regulator
MSAPARKRSERKAETRQTVLRSALELFAERGFDETSTADIAAHAGVAQGTVFLVAPSKEALASAAFAESIATVVSEARVSLPRRRPMVAQLEHLFGALFDYYSTRPAISRVLIRSVLFLDHADARSEHARLLLDFLQAIEDVITRAPDRSRLRPDAAPRDVAANCFSIYLLSVIGLLNGVFPSREAQREEFRRLLELSLRGALER